MKSPFGDRAPELLLSITGPSPSGMRINLAMSPSRKSFFPHDYRTPQYQQTDVNLHLDRASPAQWCEINERFNNSDADCYAAAKPADDCVTSSRLHFRDGRCTGILNP